MKTLLIKIENLYFRYTEQSPLLEGVSLKLHKGERIGLYGATGTGKTTLLNILVGLQTAPKGTVTILGKQCHTESDFTAVRQKVGLVFQDPDDQLFCPTVLEDVAFGPLNLGLSKKEAVERAGTILNLLGISGFEHRIIHQLSGGEKRLVSLAAILAMQPEVLLLDEPTIGLDPTFHKHLTSILCALPQTMLIVSHDRTFLDAVSTIQFELRDGTIRAIKTPCAAEGEQN